MRNLLLLSLCLLLMAGSAMAAERAVVVTPVSGNVININQSTANAACVMGNLNTPVYAITDWIWGNETYKYLFDANQEGCATCPSGFKVEAVHFFMQFAADDVPVTFDCKGDFEETVYDPTLGCFLPGAIICESPVYTVTIDKAGMYDIALPLIADDCPCAFFGYKYALGMTFLTSFASEPDLVTDDTPVGCTSYDDYGLGWYDLVTGFELPGEMIMNADIICCDNPVDNENSSWGEVKSLFR